MTSPKFRVGSRIIEVKIIRDVIKAFDGDDSWVVTPQQFFEEYTPISKSAEEVMDRAHSKWGNIP